MKAGKLAYVIISTILILVLTSCSNKDFGYGVDKIKNTHSVYNTSIDNYPDDIDALMGMDNSLKNLKMLKLDSGQKPFELYLDYQLYSTEANKLFIESQKYGMKGTTENGFGCRSRKFIVESSGLRNESANKGFAMIEKMQEMMSIYPKESSEVNLTESRLNFLNITFNAISKNAKRDASIIDSFCPQNVTDAILADDRFEDENEEVN